MNNEACNSDCQDCFNSTAAHPYRQLGCADDNTLDRVAACIWGEITDEFWSRATPDQKNQYLGIARAALTVAGVELR